MNYNPEDEIFGTLHSEFAQEPVSYLPVQISKFSIGIIAKAGLNIIEDLILTAPCGELKLRLMSAETEGVPDGQCRYSLLLISLDKDLEQIYANSDRFMRFQGQNNNFHFTRFQTLPASVLTCKTFGSTNPYIFKSINASKSGLLVISMNKSSVPFQINTLVEFLIEPNDQWLVRSIKGVGKIVHQRRAVGSFRMHSSQYFGIELKEFTGDGDRTWQESITKLEQSVMERFLKEVQRAPA